MIEETSGVQSGLAGDSMTTVEKLTLEQFLALPETEPASEFACGEAFQKPMPTRKHGKLQTYLAVLLTQFLLRSPLGEAITEWRCIFGPPGEERTFVPDIVYVVRERLTEDDYLFGPPDIAIEILSPGQHAGRFADKILFYVTHGVRMVWVIDPIERTVRVYVPGAETKLLTVDETLDGGDVLPGFQVELAELFAQLALPN
jgi:Uma2 family endonuclease